MAELEPPKDTVPQTIVLRVFNRAPREWVCVRDLTELLLQFKAALKKGGSDGGP